MRLFAQKLLLIIAAILMLSLSIWTFGHMQLGGFDMSALVDTGWRMASGQTPYADFPLTTPVAFFVGAGWAFRLFGIQWSSLVIAALIFAILVFLAQVYLLNLIIPWKLAVAISFVCQLLCSVITSYWWYNAITMSTACLSLTAAYVFAATPPSRLSVSALWASLTLLSFTKANIAGGLAVLVFMALFFFLPHRKLILGIWLAALAGFLLGLCLLQISPADVIQSYLAVGKERGIPSSTWFFNDKPYEHLIVIPLLLLSLLPLLASRRHAAGKQVQLAITLAALLMGGLSLVTNSDSNLVVGVPFFLLGSSLFYSSSNAIPEPLDQNRVWRYSAVVCIVAILAGSTLLHANYHAAQRSPNMLAAWYIAAILSYAAALLLLVMKEDPKSRWALPRNWPGERMVWAALLASAGTAILAGGMRWRVSYIGYESFFTYSPLVDVHQIPFFRNFQISPRAKTVLLEIQDILQSHNASEVPIYFGPRIEFAYAAFDIASPRNLPVWWHVHNSYPADREEEYVRSFLEHEFKIAVFMKVPNHQQADFGFLPPPIVDDFTANYKQIDRSSIIVFYRKGQR